MAWKTHGLGHVFPVVLIALLASFDWILGVGGLVVSFWPSTCSGRNGRFAGVHQYVMTLTDRIKRGQPAGDGSDAWGSFYNKDRRIEWHNPLSAE